MNPTQQTRPALSIKSLDVDYNTGANPVAALRDINIDLFKGERVGLVGESGCGKSTLLKAIMGVLPSNARTPNGKIQLEATDLLTADAETKRQVRWARIAMITQSALNALNPVHKIGAQIVEAIQCHRSVPKEQARSRAAELFDLVGVPSERLDDYPHQFSGGMRQRAVIAMALALEPEIVLADEPTTALDVIVQDQIFERLYTLQIEQGFSIVLVTHDLALVVESCERIVVMYAGMVVETGDTKNITRTPMHPYTAGLRYAIPDLSLDHEPISIPGAPPDLSQPLQGCRFAPRCPMANDLCRSQIPPLEAVGADEGERLVRCHRSSEMNQFRTKLSQQEFWHGETTSNE
ncbi:ABC transporter ATP-binding protein [Maritalea sp.]|uniref:ABC transporter ATP-binding protein n=1 Tax=Maritalea sp. TaxID=2003361 RepID=UPI003EF3EC5A